MDKDYKKLYEEALERAKDCCVNKKISELEDTAQQLCEYIFPELRESEDERIRKGLIKGLSAMRDIHKHQTFSDDAISIDDAIAWLEKQSEKKPIEQDTENRDLWEYIREWNDKFGRLPKDEDELAACIDYVMKRQKPTEWSEEHNKDLEEAVQEYSFNIPTQLEANSVWKQETEQHFKDGVLWKEQHMKEALQTEYEKGRFDMREEMMQDAVEVSVNLDLDGNIKLDCEYEFHVGDKVKIVVLKTE